MQEPTTIVAFDQHADSLMATVLPPHAATPATQALSADTAHVGRFIDRLRQGGQVRCYYDHAISARLDHTLPKNKRDGPSTDAVPCNWEVLPAGYQFDTTSVSRRSPGRTRTTSPPSKKTNN